MTMLREMREGLLNEAKDRELRAHQVLAESVDKLQARLTTINFPDGKSNQGPQPCADFRERITTCYKVNGKDNPLACAGEVEAFTECARQLSRINM